MAALGMVRNFVEPSHQSTRARRYTTSPSDANPNTGSVKPGDEGTITLPSRLGDNTRIVKGYTFAFEHSNSAARCTVTPWLWDPSGAVGAGRWRSTTGVTGAEPDKLYGDTDIGVGIFYFQVVETAGVTVNAANPLDVYVAPR